MISINILGMSKGISLFDIVTNIQSLSFLGNANDIISSVYAVFLIYLAAIIISSLAIIKNSSKFTFIYAKSQKSISCYEHHHNLCLIPLRNKLNEAFRFIK